MARVGFVERWACALLTIAGNFIFIAQRSEIFRLHSQVFWFTIWKSFGVILWLLLSHSVWMMCKYEQWTLFSEIFSSYHRIKALEASSSFLSLLPPALSLLFLFLLSLGTALLSLVFRCTHTHTHIYYISWYLYLIAIPYRMSPQATESIWINLVIVSIINKYGPCHLQRFNQN